MISIPAVISAVISTAIEVTRSISAIPKRETRPPIVRVRIRIISIGGSHSGWRGPAITEAIPAGTRWRATLRTLSHGLAVVVVRIHIPKGLWGAVGGNCYRVHEPES